MNEISDLEKRINEQNRQDVARFFSRLVGYSFWKRGIKGNRIDVKSKLYERKYEWFVGYYETKDQTKVVYTTPKGGPRPIKLIKRTDEEEHVLPGLQQILDDLDLPLEIASFFFDFIFENGWGKFTFPKTMKEDIDSCFINRSFRFVLGSGASIPYGSSSWQNMITQMSKRVCNILNLSSENLTEFCNEIYATNYGIPELLKILDKDEYYACVHKVIYTVKESLSVKEIRNGNETVLNELARKIVAANKYTVCKADKASVLTFNYDDYLERELDAEEYSNTKQSDICELEQSINADTEKEDGYYYYSVLHCHGCVQQTYKYVGLDCKTIESYRGFLPSDKRTFVLANSEYCLKYKKTDGYAYNHLYNFLNDDTIFIGNSVSDFEEQRTIQEHFEDSCFSSYHFIIFKTDKNDVALQNLKTSIFFAMGLICVFVSDFTEIPSFINKIKLAV